MAGFKRVEDRPTPKAVYNMHVYGAAITAAIAAIMIGYDSAFFGTSISLASFKAEFGLDLKTAAEISSIDSNLVSTYQAGAFFGSIFGYPSGFMLGRKWGLLLASAIFCLGAGIMLAADSARGLAPIYAGRVIAGFGIGAASSLTPLYISEIAPPAIRGQLVGMYEIGWQMGGLVGFFINYGVTQHIAPSRKQWIIPFGVQLIPGGLFLLGIPFFITESPRWLVMRSRRDEAIKNLCYIRKLDRNDAYLIQEINDIDLQVENDRTAVGTGFWAPFRQVFTNWYLARRLIIVSTLFLWQNATGINAINYYSPTVFRSLGLTGGSTSLLTTGLFGVVKTVCSLIWAFLLIDQFGRRGLLIFGSVGGAISMYIIGAYIAIGKPQERTNASLDSGGTAAIVFFYVWTLFYSLSWNGTPWVVCSEVFPGAVRQVTQCVAATSNWFWNFIISRWTPNMFAQMGYGVYLFFASMMILSIPYLALLLPETKNVPLEEMDRLWYTKNVWRANPQVMATLQSERADRQNGMKEEVLFSNQKPNAQQEFVESVDGRREGKREIA
ncbi:sugar porter family MFS transporter [Sporobolomyces salmoneus]|uniref:sugar porter family MFS transporter n=1 Tax=Sporobolomyces salmoneus TaxID=183962 RepID=UPI0031826DE4